MKLLANSDLSQKFSNLDRKFGATQYHQLPTHLINCYAQNKVACLSTSYEDLPMPPRV